VPPLPDLGTPVEIADAFGGVEEYRRTLREVQEWLYLAA